MSQPKFGYNTIIRIANKTKNRCWYCGNEFNDTINGYITIDHVTPLIKGGAGDIENLVPCCKSCNSKKRDRTVEEFRFMYLKSAGMIFTKEQEEWLSSKGIQIPEPDEYLFYFEKEGLL